MSSREFGYLCVNSMLITVIEVSISSPDSNTSNYKYVTTVWMLYNMGAADSSPTVLVDSWKVVTGHSLICPALRACVTYSVDCLKGWIHTKALRALTAGQAVSSGPNSLACCTSIHTWVMSQQVLTTDGKHLLWHHWLGLKFGHYSMKYSENLIFLIIEMVFSVISPSCYYPVSMAGEK